jgi:hypothetical protein
VGDRGPVDCRGSWRGLPSIDRFGSQRTATRSVLDDSRHHVLQTELASFSGRGPLELTNGKATTFFTTRTAGCCLNCGRAISTTGASFEATEAGKEASLSQRPAMFMANSMLTH